MASVLCDVNLWLEYAQEVRALGDVIFDPEEKEQIFAVAAGFDRIAELAKEHATLTDHEALISDEWAVVTAAARTAEAAACIQAEPSS
jgi:uncharacterized protein (DUF934 family)